MRTIKEIIDAVIRVIFGHRLVDDGKDWKAAHDKAAASRAEVEAIINDVK